MCAKNIDIPGKASGVAAASARYVVFPSTWLRTCQDMVNRPTLQPAITNTSRKRSVRIVEMTDWLSIVYIICWTVGELGTIVFATIFLGAVLSADRRGWGPLLVLFVASAGVWALSIYYIMPRVPI